MNNTLNVHRLLAHFGGVPELWHKLNDSGVSISVKTIEKWRERNTIPTPRLVQLCLLQRRLGGFLNIDDFISND